METQLNPTPTATSLISLSELRYSIDGRVIINDNINDLLNFCQVPGTLLFILHTVFLILTPWEVSIIIPNLQRRKPGLEWHV